MTREERNLYLAYKESDKMTGRNDAQKYLREKQIQYEKETVKEYMTKIEKESFFTKINIDINMENFKIPFFWTIFTTITNIILIILIFTLGMDTYTNSYESYKDFNGLSIIFISILGLFNFTLWIYAFITSITKDYEKDVNKIIWVCLIFFIPPIFPIFLDIKRKILED